MAEKPYQPHQPPQALQDDVLRSFQNLNLGDFRNGDRSHDTGSNQNPRIGSIVDQEQAMGLSRGVIQESEQVRRTRLMLQTMMSGQFSNGGNFSNAASSIQGLNLGMGNIGTSTTEYNPRALVNWPSYETIPMVGNLGTSLVDNLGTSGTVGLNYFLPSNRSTVPNNAGQFPCSQNRVNSNRSNGEQEVADMTIFLHKLRSEIGWSKQKIFRLLSDDASLLDEVEELDIVLMSRHQLGSQYLTKILVYGDDRSTKKIFETLCVYSFDLMSERGGSHMFEKLLEFCNESQLYLIVYNIVTQQNKLFAAAKNYYGVRSIENLLENLKRLNSKLIDGVMLALSPGFKDLMLNQTGSHLIRYCSKNLSNIQNKFLYGVAIEHCLRLAIDGQGCITLKCIIENIRNPFREELLRRILSNVVCLSQDPYGNYVVQHILKIENPVIISMICHELMGNYGWLSMQKYGSHVVEKCIISPAIRWVAEDFLALGSNKLIDLARDQFGNYVIQQLLKTTKVMCFEFYQRLVKILTPHSNTLQNHPNGRNVYVMLGNEMSVSRK